MQQAEEWHERAAGSIRSFQTAGQFIVPRSTTVQQQGWVLWGTGLIRTDSVSPVLTGAPLSRETLASSEQLDSSSSSFECPHSERLYQTRWKSRESCFYLQATPGFEFMQAFI